MRHPFVRGLAIGLSVIVAHALHATDTIMDGDSPQSGYLPNHNMDPSIISGGTFGQIWRFAAPPSSNGQAEQFYSKPLVYTPSSTGRQVVLAFSEQNRLYILDAVNGTRYAFRDLSSEGESPFLVTDLGNCNDISGTIGITGTPVIDPATDTVYFWAKSYVQPGYAQTGYQNGAYRFHAVDAVTLQERPGFPVNINGATADNDHRIYFTGGNVLQRTGLNLINGVIYAGFGGHCDQYNYTGWLVGMRTTGEYATGYATSGGDGAPPQDGTWNGGGGGDGIWMSGSAIASDNSGRLFFATGNGFRTDVNGQRPASGRVHLDTLSECVVNLRIGADGAVTQQDYFEPYEYLAMDNADRDLGSGGVCLPDPSVFSGGGVSRMAISIGKNGKAYVMNADNLGGYKLGASGTDAIIQTLTMPGGGSVFGNSGTYPLEGGYLYITPVGYPTQVFKLGFTSSGLPSFTRITETNESSAGRVGVGPATITSLNGQPGTAILWITDVDTGIRAYQAVPVNGQMIRIPLPASPGLNKFQRPAFGDGRYYLSTAEGNILAFGSPVALPLDCTSPANFGTVTIGSSSTMQINCTARIAITALRGFLTPATSVFQVSNATLPKGSLAVGQNFSFPASFNLTGYTLNGGSTSAPSVRPGVQTTSISILTTNAITGYSNEQPVTLSGTSVSKSPFIALNPLEVDFAGIVLNSTAALKGSDSTFVLSNIGQTNLTILGVAWTDNAVNPDPGQEAPTFYNATVRTSTPNGQDGNDNEGDNDADDVSSTTSQSSNSTTTTGRRRRDDVVDVVSILDHDGHFTATNLPMKGTVIAPGSSLTVPVNFNSSIAGDFFTTLMFYSDGGNVYTSLVGSASTVPIAVLERKTNEGGYLTIPHCTPEPGNTGLDCVSQVDFGSVHGPSTSYITLRLTNNGGSGLTVTKSKPPEGSIIGAQNPQTDFSEGLLIPPGDNATAVIYFDAGATVLNTDPLVYSASWTLNTDDLTFGVHTLNFTGTIISNQTGPQSQDGRSLYKYLGCYLDNVNGGARMEAHQSVDQAMTNGKCQSMALAANSVFAGTEYMQECWYGSLIPDPSKKVKDALCSYACAGNVDEACGGQGGYLSMYYDSTRYFPDNGTIIGASGKGPQIVKSAGAYGYAGCWTDNVNGAGRSLSALQTVSTNMTVEFCATYCAGYSIFGVEFGDECYCGSRLNAASTQAPDTDCNMVCTHSDDEFCGQGNRLSVYTLNGTAPNMTAPQVPPNNGGGGGTPPPANGGAPPSGSIIVPSAGAFNYIECRTDLVTQRTLQGGINFANVSATVETCAAFCSNYLFMGIEYASECYCANSVRSTSSTATDGRCSMTCAGNSTEICGGPNGVSLYGRGNITVPTGPAPTSSTSPAPGASPSALANATYMGCYSDNNVGSRALQGAATTASGMTIEACAAFCSQFTYFGTEYGAECYCGSSLSSSSSVTTDGRCNMACGGNNAEVCGGGYGLSLFNQTVAASSSASQGPPMTTTGVTSATISTTSTATWSSSIPTSIGSYNYVGCRSDNTTIRTLQGFAKFADDMTLEACASNCTGYTYFGVEYSKECYCDNVMTFGSYNVTDGRCNMACGGNVTEICGGPNGLTLFQKSNTTSSMTSPVATAPTLTPSSNSTSTTTSAENTPSSSVSSSTSVVVTGATTATTSSTLTSISTSSSSSSSSSTTSLLINSSSSSLSSSSSSSLSASSPPSLPSSSTSSTTPVASTSKPTLSTSSSPSPSPTLSSSSAVLSSSTTPTSSGTSSSTLSSLSSSSMSSPPSTSTLPSSSTTSSSSVKGTSTDWAYAGCANDTSSTRALSAAATTDDKAMTIEACQRYCMNKNYPLAGLEFGSQCFCGMSLGFNSTVGQTGCTKACTGDSSEVCGGSRRLSVYNYTSYVQPQIVSNISTYGYLGCFSDSQKVRTLPTYHFANSTNMTAELCVGTCSQQGYTYTGVEYGQECWCSNMMANATTLQDSSCQQNFCVGNRREYCGGANALLTYKKGMTTTTSSVADTTKRSLGRFWVW